MIVEVIDQAATYPTAAEAYYVARQFMTSEEGQALDPNVSIGPERHEGGFALVLRVRPQRPGAYRVMGYLGA